MMFKTLEEAKEAGYTHVLFSPIKGFKVYVHSLWTCEHGAMLALRYTRYTELGNIDRRFKQLQIKSVSALITQELQLVL